MIYAYLRVSTERQNLANQKDEIIRYATKKDLKIDRWVTEIVSGKTSETHRKLGTLLKRLKKGDILIVTEISRLSRTLHDIMGIIGKCVKKNVHIYSTKENYVLDDSLNSKVLSFAFGLVAEIERNLISQRTREALALKRAEGVILGRKVGSQVQIQHLERHRPVIVRMLRNGSTITELCERYNVSRSTFNRFRDTHPSVKAAFNERKIKLSVTEIQC